MKKWNCVAVLVIAILALVLLNPSAAIASNNQTVFVDKRDRVSDESGCGLKTNPCNTIQAAIDHAQAGNTISFEAGSYREAVVDKPLGFVASGRNATISSLTLGAGAEILNSVGVSAKTVTVLAGARVQDGILMVRSRGTVSVCTGTYHENLTISKSLSLVGNECGDTLATIDAGGLKFAFNVTGSKTVATIEGFRVLNAGILFRAGSEDPASPDGTPPREVNILGNSLHVSSLEHATAMYIGNGVRGVAANNTITGPYYLKPNPSCKGKGIVLAGTTKFSVSGNTLISLGTGIGVVGYDEFLPAHASRNKIRGNSVLFNCIGISVEGKASLTEIEENLVVGNRVGIRSVAFNWDGFEHSTPSLTLVRFNEIRGNVKGVESLVYGTGARSVTAELLDINWNWWGSFTGPQHALNRTGAGDEVSGNVIFSPWCSTSKCENSYAIPTKLAFEAKPGGVRAEKMQFAVRAQNAKGVLGVNFEGYITIAIRSDSSCGNLNGKLTVKAVNGRALFDDVSLGEIGDGCKLYAFSPNSNLAETTSSSSFAIISTPPQGDSLIASGLVAPEFVKVPELEFTLPAEGEPLKFSTNEVWPSDVLISALEDSGCAVDSLTTFDLESRVFNHYIDWASGRINPAFPQTLPINTLLTVSCKQMGDS